jgi:uncharacterized protein DUF1573
MLTPRSRFAAASTIVAVLVGQASGAGQSRVASSSKHAEVLTAGSKHDEVAVSGSPHAEVVELGHDFGPVESGRRLRHTFTIHNSGTAPLTILGVDVSEPGMRSRVSGPVAPGESGQIGIEWEPDRPSGNLDAQAVVRTNDPLRPRVTFTMTGVVTRSIDIRPSPDVFFTMYRDEAAERRVTIVNTEERPLSIKGIRPVGGHVTAELQTVQPGKTYELVMKVPRGLQAGRYFETVDIDTDHPRLTQLRVAVNLFVKDNLFASPEVIDFGTLSLEHVASSSSFSLYSQSTTLKKREGIFAIISITTDVPCLRIERSPQGTSGTFGFTVSIDPKRAHAGSLDGSIRIQTDDKNFPVVVLPVRGTIK